jgi:hypothetical protein
MNTEQIFDYYVYELRDPRTNETFYVGMGQGARLLFHGSDKQYTEHPKEKRIAEIRESGHADCLRVIIGSYESSEEAFAVEATLINWVYGKEKLTNINPGRHSWCLRPAMQHQHKSCATVDDYPHMEGIDRPKAVRSFDGAYTQAQVELIEQNDIKMKLEWLASEFSRKKQEGTDELKNITIIGPNLERAQDPVLVLSIDGTPVHAHLKLQLTGKFVTFNLRPKDFTKPSHLEFARHVTTEISHPYDLTTRNGGLRTYVKAEPRGSKYYNISYDDVDTILLVLKKAELRLSPKKV